MAYLDKRWSHSFIDGYSQHPESVTRLCAELNNAGLRTQLLDVGEGPSGLTEAVRAGLHVFNYVERVTVAGASPWFIPDHVPAHSYAGPSTETLRVITDKAATKRCVSEQGVRTPPAVLALSDAQAVIAQVRKLAPPLLVKPNAEAGSVGISDASVVESVVDAKSALAAQLRRFPEGVLVEEYIPGYDITVALLETGGGFRCLPLVKYLPGNLRPTRFGMYDYSAKNDPRFVQAQTRMVHAECPAQIGAALRHEIERSSLAAAAATGLRGFARLDFRVSQRGEPFFLEVNALPDVDPTSGFFIALRAAGLNLGCLVQSLMVVYPALRQSEYWAEPRHQPGRLSVEPPEGGVVQ